MAAYGEITDSRLQISNLQSQIWIGFSMMAWGMGEPWGRCWRWHESRRFRNNSACPLVWWFFLAFHPAIVLSQIGSAERYRQFVDSLAPVEGVDISHLLLD